MKTFCFALLCASAAMIGSATAETDKDAATLNQIAGYRQWTLVNPEPVKVRVPVTTTAGQVFIKPAVFD
jgi:hypothetical protein